MPRRSVILMLLAVLLSACTQAPPPRSPAEQPVAPPEPTEAIVAVEDLGSGFNPHLLANLSPLTTAVSTLVLPSVFRPDAAGDLQLDPTIATSAEVVSEEPFTVSYELNLEASWSTNTPIAAEDFVYLWEQMRAEPGVADAAGYRLVTEVRSRAGGKAVDVVFDEPYPAWRTLFSDLLPAHIVKDAPGGWVGALAGGLPASGGPFRIASVDPGRGEVVLARNDLYWDTPTALDQLVFRALDDSAITTALAVGDVDVALTEADPAVRTALGGVTPAPLMQLAAQPVVTQLVLRADDGPLDTPLARRGVAALIDRDAVRLAVAPESLPADAFALAPSQAGYAATTPAPVGLDPALAEQLLTEAGWTRGPDGEWRVDGEQVALVIGAAAERDEDLRVAELVAAQLAVAGIETTVVAPPALDLFGQETVPATSPSPTATPTATPSSVPTGGATADPGGVAVDVLVGPRTVGGDPGSELASDYGCPLPTDLVPDPPPAPGGFCEPLLRLVLHALAVDGATATAERFALAEAALWQQLPALPLFQPVDLLVSSPEADVATGVEPGALATGPIAGAARWRNPDG